MDPTGNHWRLIAAGIDRRSTIHPLIPALALYRQLHSVCISKYLLRIATVKVV